MAFCQWMMIPTSFWVPNLCQVHSTCYLQASKQPHFRRRTQAQSKPFVQGLLLPSGRVRPWGQASMIPKPGLLLLNCSSHPSAFSPIRCKCTYNSFLRKAKGYNCVVSFLWKSVQENYVGWYLQALHANM